MEGCILSSSFVSVSAKICMSLSCTKWCSSSKRFAAVILLMLTCAILKDVKRVYASMCDGILYRLHVLLVNVGSLLFGLSMVGGSSFVGSAGERGGRCSCRRAGCCRTAGPPGRRERRRRGQS